MKRSIAHITFILLLLFCSQVFYGQQKAERERRVNISEVPNSAVRWFNEVYPDAKKVKWYAEETSGRNSFEAKSKYRNSLHSVEFSEDGRIEDIEILREWTELPSQTQSELTAFFEEVCTRYKIRKIQEQWTGSSEKLKKAVENYDSGEVAVRYEIEYYGVDDDQKALWEGLFTEDGSFIEKREIILRPTDNLNY